MMKVSMMRRPRPAPVAPPQPRPAPEPIVPVDTYALTKNTVIEMFELIADESKQNTVKRFLLLRQAAIQSEQNQAFGALL